MLKTYQEPSPSTPNHPSPLRVLIIGSGGREYSILTALMRSQNPPDIYFYGPHPNPSMLDSARKFRRYELLTINREDIIASAIEDEIDLAIIGPEVGLAIGLPYKLETYGIVCIGPNQLMAQIETSKIWARNFLNKNGMAKYNPKYQVIGADTGVSADDKCHIGFDLKDFSNFVVKADGLKSGKGVKLGGDHLQSIEDFREYIAELIANENECLIEEKLIGREFSLITFSDGKTWAHAPPIQDFKRAFDGDAGPNTGGMGCFACPDILPWLNFKELAEAQSVNERVLKKLNKMSRQGYRGFLYGSYMLTTTGELKVIEFNARLGDPEAILLLDLLDSDFFEIIKAMSTGQLHNCPIKFRPLYGLVVYLCPKGYPDNPVKNVEISLDPNSGQYLIAGSIVRSDDNEIARSVKLGKRYDKYELLGSRAIAVVDTGASVHQVVKNVNNTVSKLLTINQNLFARSDLGSKLLDMLGESFPNLEPIPEPIPEPITESIPEPESIPSTYQQAGVNIEEANLSVEKITDLVLSTHTSRVVPNFGAFGGLWDLDQENYLAVSTDGVGTKVELVLESICPDLRTSDPNCSSGSSGSSGSSAPATPSDSSGPATPSGPNKISAARADALAGLGKDLFAANFNDLLCLGSDIEPMFFTDYFSSSVLDSDELRAFITGLSQACRESNFALIGGETAELKTSAWRKTGIKHYEMVGQVVARLSKAQIYKASDILPGDLVLGLSSSGPHTNGYTLINSLWRSGHLREYSTELMQPHRSYYPVFQQLSQAGLRVKGVAHITGGGFVENPPRILPDNLDIKYDWPATEWPPVFREIQRVAKISDLEMMRTFNCGIGMILIVGPSEIEKVMAIVGGRIIGRVQSK